MFVKSSKSCVLYESVFMAQVHKCWLLKSYLLEAQDRAVPHAVSQVSGTEDHLGKRDSTWNSSS